MVTVTVKGFLLLHIFCGGLRAEIRKIKSSHYLIPSATLYYRR